MEKKTFTFDGDWSFDLKLPILALIDSDEWFTSLPKTEHKAKFKNGYIPILIQDERNYEPDPLPSQLKTIEYLLNNEKEIVDGLYQAFYKTINPYYADACGDYEWIPEYRSISDLGKLIGLHQIEIIPEEKGGMAYWLINCEYNGDPEHGLIAIFHKAKLIGYSAIGEMDYESIYNDRKQSTEEVQQENKSPIVEEELKVHQPLPKYGKFKNWQLEDTEDYLRGLLAKKETEKFIHEIESNNWDVNLKFPSLNENILEFACAAQNVEAVRYLLKKGAEQNNSILKAMDSHFNEEVFQLLIENGGNIDTINRYGRTSLGEHIHYYASAISTRNYNQGKDEMTYEKNKDRAEQLKQKIELFLSLGANPRSCDIDGSDYEAMLLKRWKRKDLIERRVLKEVRPLFGDEEKEDIDIIEIIKKEKDRPDTSGKKWWKFWKRG